MTRFCLECGIELDDEASACYCWSCSKQLQAEEETDRG